MTTWTPPTDPSPQASVPGYAPGPGQGYGYGFSAPPAKRGVPAWAVILISVGTFVAGAVTGAVALGLVGFAMSDDPMPMNTVGPGGDLEAFEGSVGECFAGSAGAPGPRVDCNAPHGLEVFAIATAPLEGVSVPPAEPELSWFADDACLMAFEPYVGASYEASVLDYTPLVPSATAWDGGARTVRCVLYDMDGAQLDRSARNSRQ